MECTQAGRQISAANVFYLRNCGEATQAYLDGAQIKVLDVVHKGYEICKTD